MTVPLHVNVVPGDEAAGRIPNPTVRTEFAFQQAQRAKREASSALSAGDTAAAASALGTARRFVQDACAVAPPEMLAELQDELAVLARLDEESRYGDVARAAKLSSMDSAHKSRTHGRHQPPA